MDFNWENKQRHLQWINPQSFQIAYVMEISKEIWQGHEVFAIYLHMNLEESTTPASMQKLLKNYAELF